MAPQPFSARVMRDVPALFYSVLYPSVNQLLRTPGA